MSKKSYRISTEIKEQILNRIKHEGISVADAAAEHGVKANTVYTWLGAKAKGSISLLEYNRLKRENEQLKQLVGEVTLKLSAQEKRG